MILRNKSGKDDGNKNKTPSLFPLFPQPRGLSGMDHDGGNDGRDGVERCQGDTGNHGDIGGTGNGVMAVVVILTC